MKRIITRRSFIKGAVTAACSIASTSSFARAATALKSGEPIATLLDISKCVGCQECVYACKESNQAKYPKPEKPFPKMYPSTVKAEDWSDKTDVVDRLTPYNWLYIQSATVEIDGESRELTIPRRCMHCQNPPCVKLCPWGSAIQLDNGISRIDSDTCLGGAKCQTVCPWLIPQRQTGVGLYLDLLPAFAGNGVMYKCDRCYNKIAEGEIPACIEACPENVQTIGPRDEILKQAYELAASMNGYIYGDKENGGTNTFYLSPVPFEKINEVIEKGKGKPHFEAVADTMKTGNNLALSMVVAPVAGVAAAFAKFYATNTNRDDKKNS
ncbi:MAG: 4Fe-4S dicluster domain-containing protein [Desulfamplus sp.]|nr:4Fe-4S dicluster domain-containing protein [Desulfamplus sp.]